MGWPIIYLIMKNKQFNYVLLIFIVLFYCCNNEPRNEFYNSEGLLVKREYYSNGAINTEATFLSDTIKHGYYKKFYENGNLKNLIIFNKGKRDGVEKGYYENGQLECTGYNKDNSKNGLWISYYKNGNISYINNWKSNKPIGPQTKFYKNHNLNKYAFYDIFGLLNFKCFYDSSGGLIKEEGDPIPMIISLLDFKKGDTLNAEIIVVSPPHFESIIVLSKFCNDTKWDTLSKCHKYFLYNSYSYIRKIEMNEDCRWYTEVIIKEDGDSTVKKYDKSIILTIN
jgi:hypothetical protein